MKNTLRQPIPDYSKLLGTPYSDKDCWGIVVEFYKVVFDIELNRYYQDIPTSRDNVKNLIYSNMGDFTQVEEKDKQLGDVMVIKVFGVESHIAVYLGDDSMLHTTIHSGCVIDRVLRWKHLIVGYYRVVKNDLSP